MDEILDSLSELQSEITNMQCKEMSDMTERIVSAIDDLLEAVTDIARIVQDHINE
jgi:hypothetical protein